MCFMVHWYTTDLISYSTINLIHTRLDLVIVVVRPLLFAKSRNRVWIKSKINMKKVGWSLFIKSREQVRKPDPGFWVWDPGPGTRDPRPNKCPKGWQIILGPFARTQVPGRKYGDECPCVNEVDDRYIRT